MSNVVYQPPWILPIGTAAQLIAGWNGNTKESSDQGNYWYTPCLG